MSVVSRAFCSVHSRAAGVDSGGTAWAAGRFLIPELRLPWPANPLEARSIQPGLPEALETIWQDGLDIGVYAVASDPAYSTDGVTRIMSFEYPPALGGQPIRIDYLMPDEVVAQCLLALAHNRELPGQVTIDDMPYRDVMVCTHGSRDTCCATFGFPLYRGLKERFDQDPTVRIWRATHFGGHAFAPTMMTFPDGRTWGYLDIDLAADIVLQAGSVERLRPHYRGWRGYPEPALQLLEREAFASEGWRWLNYRQTGQIEPIENTADAVRTRIVGESPEGELIEFSGIVERLDKVMAITSCGSDASAVHRHRVSQIARHVLNKELLTVL